MTNTADYSRKLRAGFSVIELAGERLKSVRTWDFACIPGSQDARNFFSKGGKYQQHPMHRSGMLRTAQGERPGRNAPAGGQPAVIPLLVRAPPRTRAAASLGLEKALKIVVDSKPQCIMQFAQRESFCALP